MLKMSLALALLLVALSVSTLAQKDLAADIFGGYSYVSVDTNGLSNRLNANGWQASSSAEFRPHFAIEAEAAGHYYTVGVPGFSVNVWDFFGGGGPRFNYGPVFLHAIFGADTLGSSGATQSGFAALYGGGVQLPVHGHWALRAGADYATTYHNILNGPRYVQNNVAVNVGIAYLFHTGHRRHQDENTQENAPRVPPGPEGPVTITLAQVGIVSGYPNTYGVFVQDVQPGSAAERAGIRRGDSIATINGRAVRTSHEADVALSSANGQVQVGIVPAEGRGDRLVNRAVELH